MLISCRFLGWKIAPAVAAGNTVRSTLPSEQLSYARYVPLPFPRLSADFLVHLQSL
jgi:hypothetical protein